MVNFHSTNPSQEDDLYDAIWSGNPSLIRYRLSQLPGYQLRTMGEDSFKIFANALAITIENDDPSLLVMMLEPFKMEDRLTAVTTKNKDGFTAVTMAVMFGRTRELMPMLDPFDAKHFLAAITTSNQDGREAIIAALTSSHLPIIHSLLDEARRKGISPKEQADLLLRGRNGTIVFDYMEDEVRGDFWARLPDDVKLCLDNHTDFPEFLRKEFEADLRSLRTKFSDARNQSGSPSAAVSGDQTLTTTNRSVAIPPKLGR